MWCIDLFRELYFPDLFSCVVLGFQVRRGICRCAEWKWGRGHLISKVTVVRCDDGQRQKRLAGSSLSWLLLTPVQQFFPTCKAAGLQQGQASQQAPDWEPTEVKARYSDKASTASQRPRPELPFMLPLNSLDIPVFSDWQAGDSLTLQFPFLDLHSFSHNCEIWFFF